MNQAVVLQQIHYWISNPKIGKTVDGRRWVRNTWEQWQQDNFPFFSISTIRRTFASLATSGLIDVRDDINGRSYDNTNWYSVCYAEVARLSDPEPDPPGGAPKAPVQSEQSGVQSEQGGVQSEQTNTRDYTETTTKTVAVGVGRSSSSLPFEENAHARAREDISACFRHAGIESPATEEKILASWPDITTDDILAWNLQRATNNADIPAHRHMGTGAMIVAMEASRKADPIYYLDSATENVLHTKSQSQDTKPPEPFTPPISRPKPEPVHHLVGDGVIDWLNSFTAEVLNSSHFTANLVNSFIAVKHDHNTLTLQSTTSAHYQWLSGYYHSPATRRLRRISGNNELALVVLEPDAIPTLTP
ncbi:MAG: hypothetical protein GY753_18290 [Gammaproteobacteria bacterium]|nr:hypothetical protein [Gammaproteobacteria bacterium]